MSKITAKSVLKSYKSMIFLIIGITIGCIIGLVYGEKAKVLEPFGQIFLNFMFTAVVPLVFFSLSSSIAKMSNMKRLGKILSNTIAIFFITGIIASIFIIAVVTAIPPAEGVSIDMGVYEESSQMNMLDQVVKALSVSDFNLILSRNAMLPLIIFAMTFGYCISYVSKKRGLINNPVVDVLDICSDALMKMINIIMLYAPVGLGAYFASLIGTYGSELLGAYTKAVVMFFPICIFYFLLAFTAYAYYAGGVKGVKLFYKYIFPAVITSLATQSSIATLPTNLAGTKKMGVPDDIADIVLPLGATIHMDGTALTTLMKIAFLFGIFNMQFSGLGVWATAIALSVMSGVVMSGIPGGGMMGSLIIVGFYGFNTEVIPIIVTIGLLTDAIATMINATGDAVAAMMVTKRVEGKNWVDKIYDEQNIEVEVTI
ncbi:dicarboxylate/amino acid:cation symporter [Sedimentibacter hydroxybenzoicus DSM 7310]|uniref:Dicarboxylate/amino acid:cation symporter n=1 Tax=Sedimentibacter hydroxybenzoicus DSM 7310 TaxID=1123245 RepID=A0A974BLM1_SEDHY|nr:dicarboxylate/amino acid:cation symporter [Sedimentibacter hydroxybenzoicus]NYB75091.1 dicarboxylate/amino acid:cation symporter [Sedimentibacter hydroxybenzoicus DSM 7310]